MTSPLGFYQAQLKDAPVMHELLAQAGIEVPRSRMICVPLNADYRDTKPSAYVYDTHITDYGDDNRRYDLLDVAQTWCDLPFTQAVALIARLAAVTAPWEFDATVTRARYQRQSPKKTATNPNDYAVLAVRCEEAFGAQATCAAEAAAAYLIGRSLIASALHYRLGVLDSTVTAQPPSSAWRGMITFPTWDHGRLLALKGRNLLPKDSGRELRNLKGTGTPVYGLDQLRPGTTPVLVVEGETDVLSVWEAFDGEIEVVGIPGAPHWRCLAHPALDGRPLQVCLDLDEAGRTAVEQARRWAVDVGRPLRVLGGVGDKNDVLVQHGPAELRRRLETAAEQTKRKIARRLA